MINDYWTIIISGIGGLLAAIIYIYLVYRAIKKAVNESEGPLKCELLEDIRDGKD